jgi:hypothetical protein
MKRTTCPSCRRPTLTGLDNGVPAIVDPRPLTRHGELLATIAGITTFRIDVDGRPWHTNQWRIADDIPLPGDIRVAAHICDRPLPGDWLAPPSPPDDPPTPDTTEVPF